MEEALKVLLQYGALGCIVFYFLWKDSKKLDRTNEILEKIADIYKESITHERGVSRECYDKVVEKLDEHHTETMAGFLSIKYKLGIKE